MKPSRTAIAVVLGPLLAAVSAPASAVGDVLPPACQESAPYAFADPEQSDVGASCQACFLVQACFVVGDPTTGPTFPSACKQAGVQSPGRADAFAAG